MTARVGVITFPGSLDDGDARRAIRLAGAEPVALWHGAGGRLECRPEKQARQCNERSLLRRYGAGVKVLTMMREETYTEYREEMVEGAASTGMIMMDGGVGGRVF